MNFRLVQELAKSHVDDILDLLLNKDYYCKYDDDSAIQSYSLMLVSCIQNIRIDEEKLQLILNFVENVLLQTNDHECVVFVIIANLILEQPFMNNQNLYENFPDLLSDFLTKIDSDEVDDGISLEPNVYVELISKIFDKNPQLFEDSVEQIQEVYGNKYNLKKKTMDIAINI